MDKEQAKGIINNTFENPFDKNRFVTFINNLLNKVEESSFIYRGNYIPDSYKQYIKTLERIGKFDDGENTLDILIVTLNKETSLEKARTMQRNFIAWYLNGSRGGELKDAALVAFVSPDARDWRFSLVKMDYKLEQTKTGKVKVKEEFTPARRWSFIVGENEKSHTAQSRLISILENDEQAPILQEIEEAFNIETVTNEFFLKYRELFLQTKEALDEIIKKYSKVKAEFETKDIDTVNFAKKLLGQIVFLYFLQKKGWFGVERDAEWGEGSKHFLRELFEGRYERYNNFFNDILEPLFYEALRIEHSGDYYSRFNCRIPFLNGGLFDPINDYDWWNTDIFLPNDLFSNNRKTKEGDIGDGILDIFDRFNFTVKEDEPLEKEVAIDPELLGKAYEKFNAIRSDNFEEYKNVLKSGKKGDENKFNKQFGVYYTPREIVHYMCQESLINYLATELENLANEEDIKKLIKYGDSVVENEKKIINEGRETQRYTFKIPQPVRENARLIDEKLASIRICDPAVGSGAFPVVMMNEIVWIRNALTPYISENSERTSYNFKRQAIQNCLYGVDIDPGAIEITKLRLWLSLIVDEEKRETIQPLPNLDYKIMQGNSLLSEFMGIDFDKEDNGEIGQLTISQDNVELEQFENQLREYTSGNKIRPFFPWKFYFAEVFHKENGFDIVIANPPWVQSKLLSKQEKKIFRRKFTTAVGQYDLFNLFIEKAYQICSESGIVCFITPDRFITNIDYEKIRKFLLDKTSLKQIIALGDGVFENVGMPSAILIFQKLIKKNNELLLSPLFYGKFHAVLQEEIRDNERNIFPVYRNNESSSLITKINQHSINLGEIVYNARGIEIGKKSNALSETKKTGYKPFLRGEDIDKYVIRSEVYIDPSRSDINFKNDDLFKGKRILIRKTGTGIKATLDEEHRFAIQVIYIFKVKEEKNYDEKYLLALLNSKLMEYWYFSTFGEKERKTFPHLTQGKVLSFPIFPASPEKQNDFVKIVQKIFAITKDNDYLENPTNQAKVQEYKRKIDQLIYKLYELTPEEIEMVERYNSK